MNDFELCLPTKIVFGKGKCDQTGPEMAKFGWKHALVIYGKGSVVRTGTLKRVLDSLDSADIAYTEFGGAQPNPTLEFVRSAIAKAREVNADVLLAVGGGSTIDAAKATSLGSKYEGDVWDFFDKKAVPNPNKLPIATVLTIPAAGSEYSASCVITNEETNRKVGCSTELHRPALSILDPELTFTLPPYQTAAGITDMCCHILERWFSNAGFVPVTDEIAAGLLRSIIAEAPVVLAEPDNYDARANIMWAGSLAHNDLAGCGRGGAGRAGGWESHGLEHELSGHFTNVTHGAGLAVIMPAWMRYVWRSCPERFLDLGKLVFDIEPVDPELDDVAVTAEEATQDAVLATIDALSDFWASLGMPTHLSEFGVTKEDIPALIETLRITKGDTFGELQPLSMADAAAIYESAL